MRFQQLSPIDSLPRLVLEELLPHFKDLSKIPNCVRVILKAIAPTHNAHNFLTLNAFKFGQLGVLFQLLPDKHVHIAHSFLTSQLIWTLFKLLLLGTL